MKQIVTFEKMSYLCNIFDNVEIIKFYQRILKIQHRKLLTLYGNTNYMRDKKILNSFFFFFFLN